jgi:hypothetical protein
MQMEALENMPASTGLRSKRLMKKPVVGHAVVIDLADEIEEEEEREPKHVNRWELLRREKSWERVVKERFVGRNLKWKRRKGLRWSALRAIPFC